MRSRTPLGWHFKVSVRLASVSDPSGRDVKVWNSQVLDRMDIDLLGRLAMEGRVWDWIGLAILLLRRMAMIKSQRRQVLPALAWPSQMVSELKVKDIGGSNNVRFLSLNLCLPQIVEGNGCFEAIGLLILERWNGKNAGTSKRKDHIPWRISIQRMTLLHHSSS